MRRVDLENGGSWRRPESAADDDGLSNFSRLLLSAAGDEREIEDDRWEGLSVRDERDMLDGMEW